MNPPDDSLDPHVEAILKQLDDVPPSDPQTVARGRTAFLVQAQLARQAVTIHPLPRHRRQIRFFSGKEITPMTTLATILLVLALAVGGTGGTVYAAQGALPTDPLYGVKLASEDARLGLAATPADRVTLLLELAQRRVQEMVAVPPAGDLSLEPVATRLQAEVDAALQIAAGVDETTRTQMLTQIQAQIAKELQVLAQVQTQAAGKAAPVMAQVQTMLHERTQLCETGLTDPQAFQNQLRLMTREQDQLQAQTGTPQAGDQDQDRLRLQTGTPQAGDQDQDRLRLQTGTPQAGDQDQDRLRLQTGTPQRKPDPSRTPEPTGTSLGPRPTRTPASYGPGPNPSRTPEPTGAALGPGPQATSSGSGEQPTQAGPNEQPTQAGPSGQPTQAGPGEPPTQAGPGEPPTQAGPAEQPTQAGSGGQPTQAGPAEQPTDKPKGRP